MIEFSVSSINGSQSTLVVIINNELAKDRHTVFIQLLVVLDPVQLFAKTEFIRLKLR